MQSIIPVYRKHHNERYFLMDTRVPTRLILTSTGEWVKSRPLGAFQVDLLGLCHISGRRMIYPKKFKVSTIYLETPFGDVLAVDVSKLPDTKFERKLHGNFRSYETEFDYTIPENRDKTVGLAIKVEINAELGTLAWVNTQCVNGYRALGIDVSGAFCTIDEYMSTIEGYKETP